MPLGSSFEHCGPLICGEIDVRCMPCDDERSPGLSELFLFMPVALSFPEVLLPESSLSGTIISSAALSQNQSSFTQLQPDDCVYSQKWVDPENLYTVELQLASSHPPAPACRLTSEAVNCSLSWLSALSAVPSLNCPRMLHLDSELPSKAAGIHKEVADCILNLTRSLTGKLAVCAYCASCHQQVSSFPQRFHKNATVTAFHLVRCSFTAPQVSFHKMRKSNLWLQEAPLLLIKTERDIWGYLASIVCCLKYSKIWIRLLDLHHESSCTNRVLRGAALCLESWAGSWEDAWGAAWNRRCHISDPPLFSRLFCS